MMAAITVAPRGEGMTMAAASGGGDTVTGGTKAGGWVRDGSPVLVVAVGATPTVVTIDGIAQTSLTSKTGVYPLSGGVYDGRSIAVTYSQATSVTVGAQVL
jgi:hypothetical protein